MTWIEAPATAGKRLLPIVTGNRASRRLYPCLRAVHWKYWLRGHAATYTERAIARKVAPAIPASVNGIHEVRGSIPLGSTSKLRIFR